MAIVHHFYHGVNCQCEMCCPTPLKDIKSSEYLSVKSIRSYYKKTGKSYDEVINQYRTLKGERLRAFVEHVRMTIL